MFDCDTVSTRKSLPEWWHRVCFAHFLPARRVPKLKRAQASEQTVFFFVCWCWTTLEQTPVYCSDAVKVKLISMQREKNVQNNYRIALVGHVSGRYHWKVCVRLTVKQIKVYWCLGAGRHAQLVAWHVLHCVLAWYTPVGLNQCTQT